MKEKTAKKLWDFWKDAIPGVAFFIIYMLYFHRLETIPHSMGDIWMIHLKIDDCIPFMEIFIIPYLLWFGFVFLTLAWLYLYDKGEYKRSCLFMFTGMSIFLMISTVIPNGLSLRPAVFPRDNMLTDAVRALYLTDTSTNVFPSIHVYNSIACALAAVYSKSMDKHPVLRTSWVIMATLIILSTTFLKQHSVLDVSGAYLMALLVFVNVYRGTEMFEHSPEGSISRVAFSGIR